MNPADPKARPINMSAHEVRAVLFATHQAPSGDVRGTPPPIVQLVDPQPSAKTVGYSAIISSTDNKRDRSFVPLSSNGPTWHHPQNECGDPIRCPIGFPGDRVWVRETWARIEVSDDGKVVTHYRADTGDKYPGGWPADEGADELCPRWRSSTHMPRKYSRLLLEVAEISIVRLRLGAFTSEFKTSPFVWVVQLHLLPDDTAKPK